MPCRPSSKGGWDFRRGAGRGGVTPGEEPVTTVRGRWLTVVPDDAARADGRPGPVMVDGPRYSSRRGRPAEELAGAGLTSPGRNRCPKSAPMKRRFTREATSRSTHASSAMGKVSYTYTCLSSMRRKSIGRQGGRRTVRRPLGVAGRGPASPVLRARHEGDGRRECGGATERRVGPRGDRGFTPIVDRGESVVPHRRRVVVVETGEKAAAWWRRGA